MLRKALTACGPGMIALLAVTAGATDAVRPYGYPKEQAGNTDASALTAQLVKTGLYLYSFAGSGNTLLRLSANGLIVVDGQSPENYDALRRHIAKLSDQPVRLLITTDHHPEHAASNARFIADGTQVLAQENVTRNLGNSDPAGDRIAPPGRTYDRDFTVELGGITVRLLHFGSAHTDGDSVVYFPNLRVVAVGDLYAATPDPDFSAGGSLVGWGPVLGEILKLDFDVVVPGAGPTVSRADLTAFKARIDTLVSRAAGLVQQGVSKDQLMDQLQTDDLGWRLTFTGTQLDRFYAELSQAK